MFLCNWVCLQKNLDAQRPYLDEIVILVTNIPTCFWEPFFACSVALVPVIILVIRCKIGCAFIYLLYPGSTSSIHRICVCRHSCVFHSQGILSTMLAAGMSASSVVVTIISTVFVSPCYCFLSICSVENVSLVVLLPLTLHMLLLVILSLAQLAIKGERGCAIERVLICYWVTESWLRICSLTYDADSVLHLWKVALGVDIWTSVDIEMINNVSHPLTRLCCTT